MLPISAWVWNIYQSIGGFLVANHWRKLSLLLPRPEALLIANSTSDKGPFVIIPEAQEDRYHSILWVFHFFLFAQWPDKIISVCNVTSTAKKNLIFMVFIKEHPNIFWNDMCVSLENKYIFIFMHLLIYKLFDFCFLLV